MTALPNAVDDDDKISLTSIFTATRDSELHTAKRVAHLDRLQVDYTDTHSLVVRIT